MCDLEQGRLEDEISLSLEAFLLKVKEMWKTSAILMDSLVLLNPPNFPVFRGSFVSFGRKSTLVALPFEFSADSQIFRIPKIFKGNQFTFEDQFLRFFKLV